MVKIDITKLTLLPVPAGHRIRYNYVFQDKKGRQVYKDADGKWRCEGLKFYGTRILKGCIATLSREDGTFVELAESNCNPKDAPCRKFGRHIAHNRVVKKFQKAQLIQAQVQNAVNALADHIGLNDAA